MLKPFRQKRLKKDEEYLKKHSVFNVTGGLDYRLPPLEIEDKSWSNAKNVYVKKKLVQQRGGYDKFGSNLPLKGTVVGFEQFFTYNENQYFFCFTTKNIYRFNSTTDMWDLVTYNAEIQDCEDKDDWTASAEITLTDNTTNRVKGTNCLKVAVGADFTTGVAAYDDFTSANYTAYTSLHLWIKSSKATSAGDIQILLDDTSGCVSPLETLDIPALVANALTEVEVALSDPSNLTAIVSVGINIATDLGAMDIYIDDIRVSKPLTGDVDDQFSAEMMYNDNTGDMNFIATNRVDNIQVYVPGTSKCWEDLGGSPNKALIVKNFGNHLVLFDTLVSGARFPQRVEWSVQGNPADWSGEGSGNNNLVKSSDWIENVEILKSMLVIFKQRSITLMYYVGGKNPFDFEELKVKETGLAARSTMQSIVGDKIIFLGDDSKVYIYDGFLCSLISDKIDDKLADSINPSRLKSCHSYIIDEDNLYLLFVCKVSSDYPNAVWVWNYKENSWFYWEFKNDITYVGYRFSISKTTIASLTMKIGTMNWKIGSRLQSDYAPQVIFGDKNGYVYEWGFSKSNDNGTAIDAWIDTKSFILNEIEKYSRYEYLSAYAKGDSLDISLSMNGGIDWIEKGTIGLKENILRNNYLINLRTTSEQIMFRLRNNTLDENFEIAGFIIGHIDKEDVKAQDVFGASYAGGPADSSKYMEKSVYDKDDDGVVDEAEKIDGGEW